MVVVKKMKTQFDTKTARQARHAENVTWTRGEEKERVCLCNVKSVEIWLITVQRNEATHPVIKILVFHHNEKPRYRLNPGFRGLICPFHE